MREHWAWEEVKPQVHKVYRDCAPGKPINQESRLPDPAVEGRLVNLGNATGHPSRIMDGSFANQVLAQMFLFEQKYASHSDAVKATMLKVEVLPKKARRGSGAGHGRRLWWRHDQTDPAAGRLHHVNVDGPFKPDAYKY
jgi:adenosylhomocysteinase